MRNGASVFFSKNKQTKKKKRNKKCLTDESMKQRDSGGM
jgi:hypothetical protein